MKLKEQLVFKGRKLVSLDTRAYTNLLTKLGPNAGYVEFRLDNNPKHFLHAFFATGCKKTIFVLDIIYDQMIDYVRKTQNQMKGN